MTESLSQVPLNLNKRVTLLGGRQLSPTPSFHENEFIQLPIRPLHSKDRFKVTNSRPQKQQRATIAPAPNSKEVGSKQPLKQQPLLMTSKINQLNINFVGCRFAPPARESRPSFPYAEKKYRRRPMLPHLINAPVSDIIQPSTGKNRCNGTQPQAIKSSEPGTSQTKMLDFMINILKQDAEPQTSKTPSNRTQFRPSRFRTEPSVDRQQGYFYELSCGKAQIAHKSRGPKVLQNDIIKHSMNMNVVRKKLLSQHRNRFEDKARQDIKSSENHTRIGSSKHPQTKITPSDEMQMTFYPKAFANNPGKSLQDLYDNEFISIADINWVRK